MYVNEQPVAVLFDVGRFGYLDRYVALMEISQEALRHRDVPHGGFVSVALLAQLSCKPPQVRSVGQIRYVLFG
jgi:hypothetical protein